MNERMIKNEESAKASTVVAKQLNEHLELYKNKIEEFKTAFKDLEGAKFEMLFDSINKMIIFETACDMNNKYDTKGFADLIDKISKEEYMNKISMEKFDNTGKYSFITKDEIRDRVKISGMDKLLFKMSSSQR